MTLQEAMSELLNSSSFADIAKQKNNKGSKYRVMRSRFNKGELDALAMVNLLIEHDYIIQVKRK